MINGIKTLYINLKTYFMAGFILLCPMLYGGASGQNGLRDFQEHGFQYLATCLIATFIENLWLGLFLILNVILFIYSGSQAGSMQVMNVLFGCLLFTFSRRFFKEHSFSTYSKFILFVAFLSMGWAILQTFHLDPLFHGQTSSGTSLEGAFTDPVGLFCIKMAHGTYLNLALPIAAAITPWLTLPILVAIAFCSSSSCILATMTTVLIYSYHFYKRLFRILLIVSLLGTIAFFIYDFNWDANHTTFKSRIPMWHATLTYALRNPLGYGPDSFRNDNRLKNFRFAGDYDYNLGILHDQKDGTMLFEYYSPTRDVAQVNRLTEKVAKEGMKNNEMSNWDNPHNMYLQALFQYGVLGLLILIGLMRDIYYRFKFAIKDKEVVILFCMLMVYFVTGLTHFPLELARTAYLAPIILGAFYSRTDGET